MRLSRALAHSTLQGTLWSAISLSRLVPSGLLHILRSPVQANYLAALLAAGWEPQDTRCATKAC